MSSKIVRLSVSLLATVLTIATNATAVSYIATDLGALPLLPGCQGWGGATPSAINDEGLVIGNSYSIGSNLASEAFLYQNGVMTSLGTPPGDNVCNTSAASINNSGQIVGTFNSGGYYGKKRSFLYDHGNWTVLPLAPGMTESYACSINDSGAVAGWTRDDGNRRTAFVWENGTLTTFGTVDFLNAPRITINDDGAVTATTFRDSWVYENGAITTLDNGAPYFTRAMDINDSGLIAGYLYTSEYASACTWGPEGLTLLPNPFTDFAYAMAANDQGVIVGEAYIPTTYAYAVMWDNGVAYDLNTLLVNDTAPLRLQYALDINNNGAILAVGSLGGMGGTSHAFLLTPVPEPASLTLLALGGLAMMRRKSR